MQQIRHACSTRQLEVNASLKSVIDLLHSIFTRLQLKGKEFQPYYAATEDEIEEFWSVLLLIDASLTREDTTKKLLKSKADMRALLNTVARLVTIPFKSVSVEWLHASCSNKFEWILTSTLRSLFFLTQYLLEMVTTSVFRNCLVRQLAKSTVYQLTLLKSHLNSF